MSSNKVSKVRGKLKTGDRVLVLCPGSTPDLAKLEQSIEILKSWGLEIDFDPELVRTHLFFSNTDSIREKSLWQGLTSARHQMIWFARGGYGSARLLKSILKRLNKLNKACPEKMFWGLSDVTVLLNFLAKHNRTKKSQFVHGPLLEKLSELESDNLNEIRDFLFKAAFLTTHKKLTPLNLRAKKARKIEAEVWGGNLSILQTMIGTPFFVKAKEKFVLLEDVGERGYRIDRMLVHLRQAGFFEGCKGVFLGDFTGGDEPQSRQGFPVNKVQEALELFASEVDFPVFMGIESGHGLVQRPVHLAKRARLIQAPDGFQLTI